MSRILVCVAFLAIVGCGEEPQPAEPASDTVEREAAAPARERPTEVEMVAWMEAHYGAVILAHDALIQGDLDSFRAELARVPRQALPPDVPEAWLPLQEGLRGAAADAATVSDLAAAAPAFAAVALSCGLCHAALGTGPIYPAPAPGDRDTPLEAAMLEHQWATERLWEGVTGPWDNAWERGSAALAVIEVFGESGREALSEDLRRREAALREIGEEAKTTTALDARAALYARLLATCGECHQATGVTFQPAE